MKSLHKWHAKYKQCFKEVGVQAEQTQTSGITFVASWAMYSTFKPFFKWSSERTIFNN